MLAPVNDESASVTERVAAAGRACFPQVQLPTGELAVALAATMDAGAVTAGEARLAEVYLAAACARGDRDALAVIEDTYVPPLRAALRRRAGNAAIVDEVVQRLRMKVLVGDGRPPQIGRFAGSGALASWLRIAALRILLRVEREERRWVPVAPQDLTDLVAIDDPRLAAVRHRYADGLEAALADAFRGRPAVEQLLLRLRYSDGHGLDAIARIAAMHRATAARQLRRAEHELVHAALTLLGQRTGASLSGVASALRMIRSQIGLSMHAVFAAS